MEQLPVWSQRLKRERDQRQWTQSFVAREIDTSPKTVGRWERGEAYPGQYYRQKLCALFQKTPVDLGFIEEIAGNGSTESSILKKDPHLSASASVSSPRIDWGGAPHVGQLWGRDNECTQLKQWILAQGCHVVAVLGTGGIGKTVVAVTVAESMERNFDYVFWHSLKDTPPLKDVLQKCLALLSENQLTDFPKETENQIALLIEHLRTSRCLLILDNMEAVLQENNEEGQWREGYEGYGRLLKRLGEVQHHSCLILTSRERPKEIALTAGKDVRLLELKGVGLEDGKEILESLGVSGSEEDIKDLIHLYSGNPLSLKLVCGTILELFGGSITRFLKERTTVFDDVHDLLDSQFHRLAKAEQEVLYWLAIEREPTSLDSLRASTGRPSGALLRTLNALSRRYIIESSNAIGFTLQPVIMEYIINELVEGVYNEIEAEGPDLLAKYALIKAHAKDYIRESQIRLILGPIAQRLLNTLEPRAIEKKFQKMLSSLRETSPRRPNYIAGNLLNLLLQMKCDLRGYDFSQLYIRQAYLAGKFLPEVNFSQAHFEASVFTDTFGSILSVAFNRKGDLMATGATNCEMRIWSLGEGLPFFICQGHAHWIWSVAFSPDGNTVISGSEDQSVRLWDVRTGHCFSIIDGQVGWIFSVAFHPDGNVIAVAGEDQIVRLWNVHTKVCLTTLQGHSGWIRSVAFSSDGNTIISGSEDQTIRLWDTQTGTCLNILQGHTNGVRSVALNPDGNTIVSGSEDQTIRLWDMKTGICFNVLQGHTNGVRSVAFSPDGNTIVSGSEDQTIRLWDTKTGICLNVLQGHTNGVRSVTFSPDGDTIVSGSEDQTMRLWDVRTGSCLNTLQGYTNGVVAVAISFNGLSLASGSEDKIIRLWDIRTGRCLSTLQGHTNWVWALAFSPNRNILASGSEDQTIRLWDIHTERCFAVLYGHTNRVGSVAFSPQGNILASGSNDQTVRLWDVATEQCLAVLSGHTSRVETTAFSVDGKMVASGSEDKTIRLWDAKTGACLNTLSGHTDRVRSIAFNPDGSILASGSYDQMIRLWDMKTGACLNTLSGHTDRIRSVVFSPDGSILASSSYDQTIRLWDMKTGACLSTLYGHTDWVRSLAFNDDGSILASGSRDGTIKCWDMQSGTYFATLRNERPYERMNISGVTGLEEAQKKTLKILGAIVSEGTP